MTKVTLSDIEKIPKDFLTPADVAPYLGCDPQFIRVAARTCPEKLNFPVLVLNSRTRIPKALFVQTYRGNQQGGPL